MCLIFFSINQHPTYKLILAANRDEFYNRKTEAAHYWNDYPDILGGRDLEANGTWMGMTKKGRISFVTNYRDPANINPNAPSRGQLVSDYLENSVDPETYMKGIEKHAAAYNGFNLVVGNADSLWYLSNYKEGIQKITSGFYGLSNHLLETPWPKVKLGKQLLEPVLNQSHINSNDLLNILQDSTRAADDKLPSTGIGLERERALSSMFIKTDGYGTRCSTVVLIDYDNQVTFSERVYNLTTFEFTTQNFEFKI